MDDGATAILVVPKVNRLPELKSAPPSIHQNTSTAAEDSRWSTSGGPSMHSFALRDISSDASSGEDTNLSPKIPLYLGPSLFPDRAQRILLYRSLNRILNQERRVRWKDRINDAKRTGQRATGLEKASDAYLLRSDAKTMGRVDTVPVAIALWRLRLWEGEGWFSRNIGANQHIVGVRYGAQRTE
jgi:hypothetical protein